MKLALGAQQRQIDDLKADLHELATTLADLATKVMALAVGPIPGRNWVWQEFNDDQRAAALAALEKWIRSTLIRYPETFNRLRPCWAEHDAALDGLAAAFGTWTLAHSGSANAEQP